MRCATGAPKNATRNVLPECRVCYTASLSHGPRAGHIGMRVKAAHLPWKAVCITTCTWSTRVTLWPGPAITQ